MTYGRLSTLRFNPFELREEVQVIFLDLILALYAREIKN